VRLKLKFLYLSLACLISYSLYIYISYDPYIRSSNLFYITGISVAIISNLIWLFGVKVLDDNKSIFWLGIIFDGATAVASITIPILFFGLGFPPGTWVGIALVVIGISLLQDFSLKEKQ